MKRRSIAVISLRLLGLMLWIGVMIACTDTPQGRAFTNQVGRQIVREGIHGAIEDNRPRSASCGNATCGGRIEWQGKPSRVQCPHCGTWNDMTYSD